MEPGAGHQSPSTEATIGSAVNQARKVSRECLRNARPTRDDAFEPSINEEGDITGTLVIDIDDESPVSEG